MRKTLLSICLALAATTLCGQTMTEGDVHSQYILAVDEYKPAPGQFINTLPAYKEGDDSETMAQKCTAAIANNAGGMVTLGGYGGYITFHFDHSIANIQNENDFYIAGNAFAGSSEPGVVMVSKDVNGNGIADDPWYELAGSADTDSADKVIYNYEITYTAAPMQDIPWTDNQGNNGTVDRNTFHGQEYFPLWIESPLVFQGTLLPSNCYDSSGNGTYWVLNAYRYGYVDNLPNSDRDGCSFNIEWAVDNNRQPFHLDFVDFVRVYTGVNQKAGWLGETSTEVCGAEDLHLEASLDAIIASSITSATNSDMPTAVVYYTLDGKRISAAQHGINIVRMSDGGIKKIIVK